LIKNLDLDALPKAPPKVAQLLRQGLQGFDSLASIKALHLQDDLQTYGKQEEDIFIPHKPDVVWKAYTATHPAESWKGPMVNFLFAFDEAEGEIYYGADPDFPSFKVGMQFYCWLNILGPRLIIGLKLMRLDEEKRLMEIAYIEGGLYRGTQVLSFHPDKGGTRIHHKSYFRSRSPLRDATLYLFFHKKTVGEFHKNKLKLLS